MGKHGKWDEHAVNTWMCSEGSFNKLLLVWDSYECHMEESVSKDLKAKKLESLIVSGGCAKYKYKPCISKDGQRVWRMAVHSSYKSSDRLDHQSGELLYNDFKGMRWVGSRNFNQIFQSMCAKWWKWGGKHSVLIKPTVSQWFWVVETTTRHT